MRKILTLVVMAMMLGFVAKADCYLLGELEGGAWDPTTGGVQVPEISEGVYQGDFNITGYFGVATQMASSWDELNSNYRYVPAAGNSAPAIAATGTTSVPMLGPGNGDNSFKVASSGTYTITVDFNKMTLTGEPKSVEPIPDPKPLTMGCFLIGEVNGNTWAYDSGVELAENDGVYSGEVTFSDGAYFAVATTLGASGWDDLNANYRYGPEVDGTPITEGETASFMKGGEAFNVPVGGSYLVTVDLNNLTITLGSGEPTPPPTPTLPEELYILGMVDGSEWTPGMGLALTKTADGIFDGTFTVNETFGLITNNDAALTWDELNANYRVYPAESEGDYQVHEGDMALSFTKNGGEAWKVVEAGLYDIHVDLNAMTMTATLTETPPEPPTPEVDALYILGEVDGSEWALPGKGRELTKKEEGVFEGVFIINGTFGFITDNEETDWDQLVGLGKRYGNPEGDNLTVALDAPVAIGLNGNAWAIPAAGTYTVTVNLKDNTLTVVSGGDTPEPPTPAGDLFILGEVEGSEWNPGAGVAIAPAEEEGVFQGEFTINGTFGLITNNDATLTWDELNANYRIYPAESDGDYEIHEGEMALSYTKNGGEAWKVTTAGTYTIHIDLNKMTMTATLKDTPVPPTPTVAGAYLLGELEGGAWDPKDGGVAVPATGVEGVYEGTFTINGYFGVASQMSELGADEGGWDDLNANYRFVPAGGADTPPIAAVEGTTILNMLGPGNGDNSFHVEAPGQYKITINYNDMTLTGEYLGEGPTPVPTVGAFLLGELEGGAWDPKDGGVAVPATGVEGVYEGTFTITGYFGVASQMSELGADEGGWDDLNTNYRFVPADGESTPAIAAEGTTVLGMLGPGNGDNSFHVAAPGKYKITINYTEMTLTGEYLGEGPTPVPTVGAFLLGELEGGAWDPKDGGVAVPATGIEGVYEGTFTITGYFGVASQMSELGADEGGWDDLNANYRFVPAGGADTPPIAAVEGTTILNMLGPGNGDNSFHVEAPGLYKITINYTEMTLTGEYLGEGPTPVPTGDVFILGEVEGSAWAIPGAGLPLTQTAEGVYEGDFGITGSFAFITNNECADWDELNANYRYGPATDGEVTTFDAPMSLNVVPGMGSAWQIGTPGYYHVTVNLNTLTVVVGESGPTPIPTDQVYILGDVDGSAWDYAGMGLPLTSVGDGIFEGTFGINAYFCITTSNEAYSWEDLNANYRFGPETPDAEVIFGEAMIMVPNIDASWFIVTPGAYDVTVDMNAKTLTVKEASGINTVGRDTIINGIYNLQGQRVRETIPGQLYIINGKKVIARTVITDY